MKKHRTDEEVYRWNYTVNLLDGATYWFGSSLISASTILPLFISKITPSLVPIGLIGVITSAGWFLPQLFAARITERRTSMKSIIIGWGLFLERMPIWALVLSSLLAWYSHSLALILFFIALCWYALGAGVVAPAWMALVAKIFPPEKRGSFFGMTMFLGSATGIIGSAVSAWILETLEFPNSFTVLFGIAAFFMTISWVFLSLTREPHLAHEVHDQDWAHYWQELLQIIRKDQNYRRYVITSITIALGSMGAGFVTISAIQRFQVADATVGLYTLIMLVGQTVGNLVLGWMADRYGHKLSIEIGVFSLLIAFILSFIMPSPIFYFVVYALLGINLSSGIVSGMLVVWEFCETTRVPTYSGLTNTARGIIGLIAPVLAIQFANISYEFLFAVCTVIIFIGLLLLRLWVKEPRFQGTEAITRL